MIVRQYRLFRSHCLSVRFLYLAGLISLILLVSIHYRTAIHSKWNSSTGLVTLRPTYDNADDYSHNVAHMIGALFDEFAPAVADHPQDDAGIEPEPWPATEDAKLVDVIQVSSADILAIRDAHTGYVEAVTNKLPEFIAPKGAAFRGIVTVGGAGYFPPLMVSLRLLRRTGNSLPVEIFLPPGTYEEALCKDVLPKLNAACRVFPDSPLTGLDISHFQLKAFAILLSSFTEVLWLDADSFPLRDVSPLFTSEPFTSTGLVTWPDLWQTSISPAYYLVSSQEPSSVSQRASTESGQLLISKKKHWRTLLLAAYYNYFGPSHYYALFCQNGAGCGDKDTFLPAAEAMCLPFYDVKSPVDAVGHRKSIQSEDIYRFALVQYDPVQDYEAWKNPSSEPARPFFLHMSVPKWDAYHVFDHVGPYDLTRDRRGNKAAAFRDPAQVAAKIPGVERMVWEETKWTACNLEDIIGFWEGKRGHICEKMKEYFHDVLDTDEGKEMGLGADVATMPVIDDSG